MKNSHNHGSGNSNPQSNANNNYINVHSKTSELAGIAGFIETLLRRFRIGFFVTALAVLYSFVIIAMGISMTPGVYLVTFIYEISINWWPVIHYMITGIAIVIGYFLYGFSMIFIIPLFNFIMPFRVKPFRGSYYSIQSIPWYFHNAFLYVVRYTFLEFITPTPLNVLFYRMMGMKIEKGVHINTTNISDAGLIELGDYVTIGGSATIFAHYATKGYLVLSKVKIGSQSTIGIKATIMGDVEIGKNVVIAPHEVILPKSRIPDDRKPPKEQNNNKW